MGEKGRGGVEREGKGRGGKEKGGEGRKGRGGARACPPTHNFWLRHSL